MKKTLIAFLCLLVVTQACALDFNPPPLSLTPSVGEATRLPLVIIATPTFTAVPPTVTPVPPTGTSTPAPTETQTLTPTATTTAPVLTVDQLRNATYTFQGADQAVRTITLKDGKFESGTDSSKPGFVRIQMGNKVAFGDLNGDGLEDAAIIIVENYGGSGAFVSVLAVLNQGGKPGTAYSALIDDRTLVNEVAIKDGLLFVDAVIHGPSDAMCCPSVPSRRFYRLIAQVLVLVQFSTRTPDGIDRIIQIDSPVNQAEINGPFVIKGNISISPFENTLGYAIYQPGKSEPLKQGSFMVVADGLGGPGTFELPLDPGALGIKGQFWVQISDLSPANGAFLAVNSVSLVMK